MERDGGPPDVIMWTGWSEREEVSVKGRDRRRGYWGA